MHLIQSAPLGRFVYSMKSFATISFGCQQNEHDSVRVSYLLKELGLNEVKTENADLIIIVACSVRQTAVDRIFGIIKNNPKSKIIVTGCVLDHDKKKLSRKSVSFWDIEHPEELASILGYQGKDKFKILMQKGSAYSSCVPIMFGCNNFCTYCATALTRGRERSRKADEIIRDVKTLVGKGNKKILLLGQTIDSYQDPQTGERLDGLLKKLNDLEGNFEISFLSNHPKDMTDEIIEAVATLPKLKKEIHLPVQSGSDKILRAMNRPYSVRQYLELVRKIRKANPKIKITTDVIVGFPGETQEDFQKTVELFNKVNYSLVYVNKYSPRPQTAAYKLGDPIPWSEKQRRWRILNDIANR